MASKSISRTASAVKVTLGSENNYPKVTSSGFQATRGNTKLGQDTLILNMGSSWNCPSRILGLCKVCKRFSGEIRFACYADKAEFLYPQVYPYREAQANYWLSHSASEIISDLSAVLNEYARRGIKIKYLRFNEAGDFWKLECVNKMSRIAEYLKSTWKITTYGYSARSDLDFTGASFQIKGSGWEGPNGMTWVVGKSEEVPAGYKVCPGDCRKCSLCKRGNHNIAFHIH
jgi:hypothetical protein